jgi:hypothetical protein
VDLEMEIVMMMIWKWKWNDGSVGICIDRRDLSNGVMYRSIWDQVYHLHGKVIYC